MEAILLNKTISFVKQQLTGAESGHDWFHIELVWKLALYIAKQEGISDTTIIELGALLHDIADAKFHNGDETIAPRIARDFLTGQRVALPIIDEVVTIIQHISFKAGFSATICHSRELDIVQDADRLDALGAIGIARAFNYGGFKNRRLYDPGIPPVRFETAAGYKKNEGPTLNHFYEKLFLLKDKMNTVTGKKIAEERHAFMEIYVASFLKEWNAAYE